jgi:HK97 family phage portal protein
MKIPFIDNIAKRLGYSKSVEVPNVMKKTEILPWDKIDEDDSTMNYFAGEAPARASKEYLKSCKSWVYTCVAAISDEIATMEFKLYKIKGKNITEIEDHPLLDLLYKVNGFTTKFDHLWLTQEYLELVGEAPWLLDRGEKNNQPPTSIWLLRPDKLTVLPDPEKVIGGYKYQLDGGSTQVFKPEQVIFLKYPDPERPLRGVGTLSAVAQTVDLDYYSEKWNLNFIFNSARPDSVLTTDQTLSEEQVKRIGSMWKEQFKGIDKVAKTAILEGGLKYTQLQISQKDMDFMEQQRFSRDKILSIFRVPKAIVAITDDVNRASADASAYAFARWTIKPKMERIIEQLNEFLVPMFGDDLFLGFDDPVPENVDAKLRRYDSGLRGWLTPNEIRQEEGLEPVEGGDELSTGNNSSMPVSTYGFKAKLIDKEIRKVNRTAIISKRGKLRKVDEINSVIKDIVRSHLIKSIAKDIKDAPTPNLELTREEKFWNSQVKIADKFEKDLKTKFSNVFENQRRNVLSKLPEKSIDISKILLDVKEETGVMVSITVPILKNIIKEQGDKALELVGLTDEVINIGSSKITQYLKKTPIKFATSINKTTNRKIREQLSEGIGNKESIQQLSERINEIFGWSKEARSETIARTETFRATGFSTEEAYRQSGVVTGKEWLTAFDERTCEFCGPMNGKVIPLGETYIDKGEEVDGSDNGTLDNDYGSVDFPPLHPSCRCTLIPVLGKSMSIDVVDNFKTESKEELKKIKVVREKLENLLNNKKDE